MGIKRLNPENSGPSYEEEESWGEAVEKGNPTFCTTAQVQGEAIHPCRSLSHHSLFGSGRGRFFAGPYTAARQETSTSTALESSPRDVIRSTHPDLALALEVEEPKGDWQRQQ